MSTKENIEKKYAQWILENGSRPGSVYVFCKKHKMSEAGFYEKFSDFESVEAAYLTSIFDGCKKAVKEEAVFEKYSGREKLLALYYTYFETLASHRSYLKALYGSTKDIVPRLKGLRNLRSSFMEFAEPVMTEARYKGELENRRLFASRYKDVVWLNFCFVFNFWMNDHSIGFERTDACIEKSLNLTLDLLARNTVDQLIDFGKFMFSSSR